MLTPLSLSQILTLYIWFPFAALLFFMALIARFYQRFSGEKTHFRAFSLPMVCSGIAAVRYASIDRVNGDAIGAIFSIVASVVTIALAIRLYRQMTARESVEP